MTKNVLSSLIVFFGLTIDSMFGQGLPDRLFITSGQRLNIDSTITSWRSFSTLAAFGERNPILTAQFRDTLSCWLINLDSVSHSFEVSNHPGSWTVNPSDSTWVNIPLLDTGVFQYRDPSNNQGYLGLSGMLVVAPYPISYYWNLRAYDTNMSESILKGNTVYWTDYEPDYFTVNGKSNPSINLDSMARVTGVVGDSINIYISNAGMSIHSLHFHGFHARILTSSKFPIQKGWFKDTFPIYPNETLHLLLVPDKPGEYPVHDHNLVATSGANIHPFGMVMTLLISQ